MGSFLDKPKTEKEVESVEGNGLRAGCAAMQGWRVDMEDSHTLNIGLPDSPTYNWFAVYDGHGGAFVSRTAAVRMVERITNTADWKADHASPESLSRAIRQGFLDFDEYMKTLPEVSRGDDHSGSTAITALVTPTHILVGNCGDSRSILIRSGAAVAMSEDHKPYNPGEQARIEAAGGAVTMRRVNGDLAVSRALGDFVYKHVKDLPAEKQQVSAEPEVKVVERDNSADEFLVLACDGIWDVMSNEEVAAFIVKKVQEGLGDVTRLAGALIDECLHRNSRDNMSALVVALPGAKLPSAEEQAAYDAKEQERAAGHRQDDATAGMEQSPEEWLRANGVIMAPDREPEPEPASAAPEPTPTESGLAAGAE